MLTINLKCVLPCICTSHFPENSLPLEVLMFLYICLSVRNLWLLIFIKLPSSNITTPKAINQNIFYTLVSYCSWYCHNKYLGKWQKWFFWYERVLNIYVCFSRVVVDLLCFGYTPTIAFKLDHLLIFTWISPNRKKSFNISEYKKY